jgi:uncharacterized membrane protein
MEALVILLFIVIIVMILTLQNKILQRLDRMEKDLGQLWEQFSHFVSIAKNAREGSSREPPDTTEKPRASEEPRFAKPPEPVHPAPAPTPTPVKPPVETEPFTAKVRVVSAVQSPPPQAIKPPPQPPQGVKPALHEPRPDLEKFIGENLISKIGIAILVLAIGFFVKYAIDNDWIGPAGRVGIGLLCGGVLVGFAHVLRKNYKSFSSVLVGGGLAIFYFTIALAYHQYQLFGQTVSFVIMVVITAFAVILSLLYDRQELAIIALVGGFVAPFLVSNGRGNYQVLFSYLLILNTGLLVIAYNKAWRLLNVLAFVFTALLFASWLFTLPDDMSPGGAVYGGGFLFATAFYILFFAINIAYTIKKAKRFIASDFGILLANTCCYFAAGLYLITEMGFPKYRGLFSASMGIFNLAGSYFLFRKKSVDSNILYLLVGITLTFVSLTAPIQLHGHAITIFWASEAVLLYWLSKKSGIRIIAIASILVGGAMLISLVMDWVNVYWPRIYTAAGIPLPIALPVIFNKGLMTTFYAACCCFALFFLRKKDTEGEVNVSLSDSIARHASVITGSLLFFAGGALEIHHQFSFYYPGTGLFVLYLILYGLALASLITYIGNRWRWFRNYSYTDWILTACLIVYLMLIQQVYEIQTGILNTGRYREHFMAHWVAALLVLLMLFRLTARLRAGKTTAFPSPGIVSWGMGIFAVIFLSVEVHMLVNNFFYNGVATMEKIDQVYIRAGLPILWGLCSYAFMWMGMRYKFKPLRVLSLALFSVTLLKLFLFDIRDIPVAGKIAAFFCLGVLLLVVSFMYQRLKKIIIEDEEKKNE